MGVSLWRRAYARNVRLYYPYRQYTALFIFWFVSLLCLRSTTQTFVMTHRPLLRRKLVYRFWDNANRSAWGRVDANSFIVFVRSVNVGHFRRRLIHKRTDKAYMKWKIKVAISCMPLHIYNLWILLRKIVIYLVGRKSYLRGLFCCWSWRKWRQPRNLSHNATFTHCD